MRMIRWFLLGMSLIVGGPASRVGAQELEKRLERLIKEMEQLRKDMDAVQPAKPADAKFKFELKDFKIKILASPDGKQVQVIPAQPGQPKPKPQAGKAEEKGGWRIELAPAAPQPKPALVRVKPAGSLEDKVDRLLQEMAELRRDVTSLKMKPGKGPEIHFVPHGPVENKLGKPGWQVVPPPGARAGNEHPTPVADALRRQLDAKMAEIQARIPTGPQREKELTQVAELHRLLEAEKARADVVRASEALEREKAARRRAEIQAPLQGQIVNKQKVAPDRQSEMRKEIERLRKDVESMSQRMQGLERMLQMLAAPRKVEPNPNKDKK